MRFCKCKQLTHSFILSVCNQNTYFFYVQLHKSYIKEKQKYDFMFSIHELLFLVCTVTACLRL